MALADYFPLAALYRGVSGESAAVRESPGRFKVFPYTERHLHCVWFDPALRPSGLRTSEGESLEVEDPGVWNLEAGPDFLGASLRVGPNDRRLRGDIEIHIHPGDWIAHGHRDDPRYARVCAHVTFFSGPLASTELPPGAIQVALRAPLAACGAFSFDAIDVSAYPFASRAALPPCQKLLRDWPVDAKQHVLDAAGQERLRRKAARFSIRLQEVGSAQLIYEETLAVFGYKHNKQAFRILADRVPLSELRETCRGNPLIAQAILLGVAGLIPKTPLSKWDSATRARVRSLWDAWFKQRERWADRLMEPSAWRTSGLRPANHPARRIAAAASLFAKSKAKLPCLLESALPSAARVLQSVRTELQQGSDAYWDRRLGWGSRVLSAPVSLVGADRIQLLLTNLIVPLLAADGRLAPFDPELLAEVPPEGNNQVVRQTAFNLFGAHHPASWYRTGLRRQGLIQIFHDYCLNDRSRCATCAFPDLLRRYNKESNS